MAEEKNGVPIRVDRETYKRLKLLARATERSVARTVKVLAMRAKPEELGAVSVPAAPQPDNHAEDAA